MKTSHGDARQRRPMTRPEASLPNIRWLLALITLVHRSIYLASGGRLGDRFLWIRFLLLIYVGHKTGRDRITPLLYIEDEGHWAVVASNGGDRKYPSWWLNLKSRPDARIQVGREQIPVKSRRASPAECERLWPRLTASYPYYPEYRHRAHREIPIVILERAA